MSTRPKYRISTALTLCCLFSSGAFADQPVYTNHKDAHEHPGFDVQGEYVGTLDTQQIKLAVQVVALGDGKYSVRPYVGGLPGDGWDGEHRTVLDGVSRDDGSVLIQGENGEGVLKDDLITISANGAEVGKLERVRRKSSTLKMAPPAGAIVLFDGTSTDEWNNAELDGKALAFKDGSSGASSKQKFGNHRLHIEFRTPFMPEARGQGRGNSGLYLQSRYEVQMLDSFGLKGEDHECGGIYSIAAPKVNMCFPPLVWQTYDVEFTAAKYDESGNVTKNPRITVRHNDVLIHDDVELPKSTTAAPMSPGPEDGPVFLQNHGNPVRYRNIWLVPGE